MAAAETLPTAVFDYRDDSSLLALAREIAIDHYPLDDILKKRNISYDAWAFIKTIPRFSQYLAQETAAWESAKNTPQRIKLKSAAIVELFLVEAHSLLHDSKHGLNHRVTLLTQVMKLAGLGDDSKSVSAESTGPTGDKVNITINIGSGAAPVQIDTSQVTIEHEPDDQPIDFDWEEEFPITGELMDRVA